MSELPNRENIQEVISEARRALQLFRDAEWCATAEQTDQEHHDDYKTILAGTRSGYPEMPEKNRLHFIKGDGGKTLAVTGNSPTSGDRARALVAFIQVMPILLDMLDLVLTAESKR
ncbi:hypothetical protein [Bradyrhizobium sp. SZCCHNR3118]|uniref:hypothetical protein n=1 Tax=Bradyrhizobium sp. SZCCHNR3118 TaxID=3057468 RepID=UPI002916F3D1|nr:hypothetical protein [Bradyrhizobium sp. SZCCHNR3118]